MLDIDEKEFMTNLRHDFLIEAEELVGKCDACFLEFERNPENLSIIDEVFRIAHTLKGSAMTAKFDNLGKFAHNFEHVLIGIRTGNIKITKDISQLLFESNDLIAKIVESLKSDHNSSIDISITQEKLLKAKESSTPQREQSEKKQVQDKGDGYRPNLLLVDDDVDVRGTLKDILEEVEFSVTEVEDGTAALAILAKGYRPKVIVSDYKMPKMDGIELTQRVREIFPRIPVIICSAFSDRKKIIEFMNLGSFGFVDKPPGESALQSMAKQAVKTFEIRQLLSEISVENNKAFMKLVKLTSEILVKEKSDYQKKIDDVEDNLKSVGDMTRKILSY